MAIIQTQHVDSTLFRKDLEVSKVYASTNQPTLTQVPITVRTKLKYSMNLIGLKCKGAIHPGKLGNSIRAIIALYVQKLNMVATSPTKSSPFSIPLLLE